MVEKRFRPFWSFDILRTEKWLADMGEKGFYCNGFNRFTRVFSFHKGEPRKTTYEIGYEKVRDYSLPNALREDGWEKICQNHHWYLMENQKPKNQIKTSSVRESIIKRNRIIYYIFWGILFYFAWTLLLNPLMLSVLVFNEDITVTVVESPLWIITYIGLLISILLCIISIYSIFKIRSSNKKLLDANFNCIDFDHDHERIQEGKQSEQNGELIKKRKFVWIYEPDKLEKWLENMEAEGYNLVRVGRLGTTFYFIKGKIRTVSYCVEYQNIPNETVFFLHKENGWKNIYSTKSNWQKWTIWAKEYSDGEEKPQIYNEKETHLKAARKISLTYSIMFWPIMLLYAYIIINEILWALNGDLVLSRIKYVNMVLFVILFLQFGSFTFRTWSYYFRLKKRYGKSI